jgi:uncharacterized membrane protein (DUF4010 family)
MTKHSTPLHQHIKEKHLWLDITLLIILWLTAILLPKDIALGEFLKLHLIFKIVSLFATLELMSFLLFHFTSGHRGLLLQGLLGGFISSTATYIQLLGNEKFSVTNVHSTLNALLLAKIAMLVEAIMIVTALSNGQSLQRITPFALQFSLLFLLLIWNVWRDSKLNHGKNIHIHVEFDHPIIWKNVLKLSGLILLLVTSMHYLEEYLHFSEYLSAFIISLFEAHSVLASVLIKAQSSPQIGTNQNWLFTLILLGSTISKIFLVIRSQFFTKKKKLVLILCSSILAPIIYLIIVEQLFVGQLRAYL